MDGVDINPATLDEEENEDLEEGLRVIIVYRKEEEEGVLKMLGVDKLEKITYKYEELKHD